MPPIKLGKIKGLTSFQENMGGLTGRGYLILLDDIATEGTIQYDRDIAATTAEVISITTAHVPVATEGFIEVYITQDKGKFMFEPTGERDSRGFLSKAEISIPGHSVDNLAYLQRAMSDRVMLLVETLNNKYFQIGTKRLPGELTYSFDSGTNSGGYKGTKVEVSAYEVCPIIYDAAIPMKP